jgi:hypothetical protein
MNNLGCRPNLKQNGDQIIWSNRKFSIEPRTLDTNAVKQLLYAAADA